MTDAVREWAPKKEMAWRCPKCGRVYRGHVFEEGTSHEGPMCNACGSALEWVELGNGGEQGSVQDAAVLAGETEE